MESNDSSRYFDAHYYAHNCGEPYQHDEKWLSFFGHIADHIMSEIHPATVLDAGCAWGFLVEALRQRDVEAFGVDISEYAIQNVQPDIKPYCWVGSIADPFPQKYDLIVSIEVLEHMPQSKAEKTIENLCCHTDDILFSSSPIDYKEATHFNVQPPEYWTELFARMGFIHDVEFDASFITPWAMRFRRAIQPASRSFAMYERRLWRLEQENRARRELGLEQREELVNKESDVLAMIAQVAEKDHSIQDLRLQLAEKDRSIQGLRLQLAEREYVIQDILNSRSWYLIQRLQSIRRRLIPEGSHKEQILFSMFRGWRLLRSDGIIIFSLRLFEKASRRAKISMLRYRHRGQIASRSLPVNPVAEVNPILVHQATVDIVICVHNALDDITRCLESILRYTTAPYSLILVDDGSDSPTRDYLSEFSEDQGALLLRNEQARGYTYAANQGLKNSSADYVILLNSDTIVTPQWLDRMTACAESDGSIGLVGPLSNTASWQSIPKILNEDGDWEENVLPEGMTVTEMGTRVAKYSTRTYPRIPFLNGFCILIKRAVIKQIGIFDEETFGEGYGEENDYCLRARKAGWELAIADDTYIYHAQSKSYSHERRKQLSERADKALATKYGQPIINNGVYECRFNRMMVGNRARILVAENREQALLKGKQLWEGKRVLFILPVTEPGGGGHVILQEAEVLQKMGVDVRLLNLVGNRPHFENAYPDTKIPSIYIEQPQNALEMMKNYDAIIATVYHSLNWMDFHDSSQDLPIRGYYIQDFEPAFFPEGTKESQEAWDSYTRFPDLVRITKTEWNRARIIEEIGVESIVVGPSLDIDLFRPRRRGPEWPDRALRIAAMIRPSTPRRQAALTMETLREASRKHGNSIEIILFGCSPDDPEFHKLATDFPWRHAGILTRPQLANLFNDIDIFTDFSAFQAMGLTAMEAMACGSSVIVPTEGGAISFARHESNALIIDTSSIDSCLKNLDRLIDDENLRTQIHLQAIRDMCQYYPENVAINIMNALFQPESRYVA